MFRIRASGRERCMGLLRAEKYNLQGESADWPSSTVRAAATKTLQAWRDEVHDSEIILARRPRLGRWVGPQSNLGRGSCFYSMSGQGKEKHNQVAHQRDEEGALDTGHVRNAAHDGRKDRSTQDGHYFHGGPAFGIRAKMPDAQCKNRRKHD